MSVENTTKDGQFTKEKIPETEHHLKNSGNITSCVFIFNFDPKVCVILRHTRKLQFCCNFNLLTNYGATNKRIVAFNLLRVEF